MSRIFSTQQIVLYCLIVFLSNNAVATIRTWDGGGANFDWTTPDNWSGNIVPGATDTAIFDGTSSKNCQTIAAQITVGRIAIMSGYTGTITQSSFTKMNIGNGGSTEAFYISGGTFTGSSNGDSIILAGAFIQAGGTFTSTNGWLIVKSAPFIDTGTTSVFNHNNGYVHINGNNTSGMSAINARSAHFYNLDLTMGLGTCVLTGSNRVNGTLTIRDGVGSWSGDTLVAYGNVISYERSATGPNVLFGSTGVQTFTANGALGFLGKVHINKSGGSLTLNDTMGVADDFFYVAGNVTSVGAVKFQQINKTISSGTMSFNHVIVAPNGGGFNSYIAGNMDVNGDLTLTGGSSSGLSNGTATVAGNLNSSSTFSGSTPITLDGTGTQLLSGCFTNAAFTISKASGIARLSGNSFFQSSLTITSGTLDQGTAFGLKTGGLLTVGAGCSWTNSGTGYDSLGGNVVNNGTITFGRSGAACNDAQYINIRSTAAAARDWNTGTAFTMTDVNAKDMKLDISRTFSNSISSGNNTNVTTTNCADANNHIWMGLGADNNWSTAENWNPPHVPSATDTVIFDGTSSKQSIIDPLFAGNIRGVIIKSTYLDSLKLNRNLTVTRGFNLMAGATAAFVFNSHTLTIQYSGSYPVYDTLRFEGGYTVPGTGKLRIYSPSVSNSINMYIGPGHNFYNMETYSGHWFIPIGYRFTVLNDLNIYGGGWNGADTADVYGNVIDSGSTDSYGGYIRFCGTGNQSYTGKTSVSGPSVIVEKVLGTLSLIGTIKVRQSWSQNYGTVDAGSSTVSFSGGSFDNYIKTNGMTFYNLICSSGWWLRAQSDISVTNNCTFSNGSGFNLSGYKFFASGNVTSNVRFISGTNGQIIFNGSTNATFTNGYSNASYPSDIEYVSIRKSNGSSLVLSGYALRISKLLSVDSGVFDQGINSGLYAGLGVTLLSGGSWLNSGTGYDSLGGNVTNNGIIHIGRSGNSCLDGQYILIRSTNTTQRLWSGSGSFNVADVDVSYMTGTITAVNSFNSGNNGWTLLTPCVDGNRHYWYASTAGNWNVATNWTPPYVPAATDTVIFSNVKSVPCSITTSTNIGSMRINTGYNTGVAKRSGTILTIGGGGFFQNSGTFYGNSAGHIDINGDLTLNGGTFNSTPDTLFISGIASANNSGNFKINGGSFVHNNGVVKFDHYCETYTPMQSCSLRVNGKLNLNSLVFYSSQDANWITTGMTYNLHATDTLVVNGTYSQGGNPSSGGATRCIVNGGVIEAKASVAASICALGGKAKIVINGNTAQTYMHSGGSIGRLPTIILNTTGSFSANTGTNSLALRDLIIQNGTFNAPPDTLLISGNEQVDSSGNFIITGGVFNHNNGTVKFDHMGASYHQHQYSIIDVLSKVTFNNLWILNSANNPGLGSSFKHFSIAANDTLLILGKLTLGNNIEGLNTIIDNGVVEARGDVAFLPGIGSGTGKILFSGGNVQTITQTGANSISGGWEINKSTLSNSVVLGSSLTIPCPLIITYGTLDQGASYNLTLSSTLSLTGANSTLRNTGNGDLFLGANVTNNGLIDFNGYGYSCGDADDITVTSTPAATARSWSGTGRIRMYDVTPSYMTGTQTVYCISSTNGGGNGSNWIFKNSCEIDTVSRSIGTASGVLYSTTGSTNNTGDTVTLSAGTLPLNVGEGDSVRIGSSSSFIKKKINTTRIALQSTVGINLTGQPLSFYRRYSSVAAWNTARAADLVAQNTIEKGVCYNDGAIPGGSMGVFYTDSAHYPILTSEPSQKHKGIFGSGVRINSTLTVSSRYAVVDGLEIFPSTRDIGIRANSSKLKIRNNIVKNATDGIYLHDGNGASDCYAYNNVFFDASNRGISSYINNNSVNGNNFYHNTFYKCATGIYTGGTRARHDTVVNNIAIGNSVNYALSVANTYANFNAGESTNMPQMGANNVATTPVETFADTSTAGLNLALSAASQCINAADSALPSKYIHTDILDTIRSRYNKWDMGAFEFGGLAFQFFTGTHIYTIGTMPNVNVSVASVTGSGPWTISFSGNPDLSQININDCFTDGYTTQGKWKIISVDDAANTIVVQNTEYASGSGTYPSSRNDLQASVGRWFSTLQAWEDNRGGDLVSKSRKEIGVCYNDGPFTSGVNFSGNTTNSNYFMHLKPASATISHNGRNFNASKLRIELTGGGSTAIGLNDTYSRVEGLQIKLQEANQTGIQLSAANTVAEKCIVYLHPDSTNATACIGANVNAAGAVLRNSIIYGKLNTGLMISNSGSAYNNTIYGMTSGTGVNSSTANTIIKNVISLGSQTGWFGTTDASSGNNAGEMSILGGSSVITTAAAEFTNITTGNEDFRLLYGANSVNRGTDLTSTGFTDDIIGDARPFNGIWDCGAYEYRRLTLSKSDSTTSSVSFSYLGGSSLEADEDSIFVWLTPVKSSIGVGAATDTILKSNLTTVQTYTGLSTATLYYVGTIVKSNLGAWGAPVIDSIYVKVGSPLTLNLTSSTLYGELHIEYPNRASISPNIDSVIVYYRGSGYNQNPYALSIPGRDTSFSRAEFLAIDTIKVKNLPTGTNTYYVSSTLIDNLYGQSYRSLIPGNSPNDTDQVTTTYDYPSNFLTLNPMSSDTNSVLIYIDRLDEAEETLSIAGVYLFHASSSDSASLASQYRTMTIVDSIPRLGPAGFQVPDVYNSPRVLGSLADGEKHYFGVATRNSLGYWSRNINIMSFWTRPKNTLRLAIAPTPALGDSGIVCTLFNVNALPPNADSIQLFIGTNVAKDPQIGPDTAFNLSAFAGSDTLVFTRRNMASNTKYFFTARAGLSTNTNSNTRWGVIDTASFPGNWDTVTTPDFGPSSTPSLQLGSVTSTSAQFYVPSQSTYNSISDSVFFFIETDSANLVNNWRSIQPWSVTDTAGSRITQLVDTLTNGGTYWIGVASRSKQRIWSTGLSIQKVETSVNNPLFISWQRVNNSQIAVKINGIQSLASSATTIKLWNRKSIDGGYQSDATLAGDSSFSISFPFASDTLSRLVTYPVMTSDTFYYTVSAGYPGNWAGITGANRQWAFIDNTKPVNVITMIGMDSTPTTVSYQINNSAALPSDVDSIMIYTAADYASLFAAFQSRGVPYSTVGKSDGTRMVSGLSQASRIWIGAAVKDKMGNWADSIITLARYTKPFNPLSVEVSESGTSGQLRIVIHGVKNLDTSIVDSVRLFYNTVPLTNNPRTYDPSELKGTYWAKALWADSVITATNFQSQRTYYFAVNERVPKPGIVLYGDIGNSNDTSFITGDYAEPTNISLAVIDSTSDSLKYRLNKANLLLPGNADIKNVFIYYGTDASAITSTYKTAAPAITLSRVDALLSDTLKIGGLAEGTKFYVGVAVMDSSNNWSTSVQLDSARTKVRNPLALSVNIRSNNNRIAAIGFTNLDSLGPKVDSIRLWYRINTVRYVPDSLTLITADTVIPRALMGDTVYVTLPDNLSQRFCFSATPSIFEEGRVWAARTTNKATDTIFYDSDEPANSITLRVVDTALTSIDILPQGSLYLVGSDVESLYVWYQKVGSAIDSATLATQFKLLPPQARVSVDDLIQGRITSISINSLDTGASYYFAIAPKDTNNNYSTTSNVFRFKCGTPPFNPLTLAGIAPLSSFARITISNLQSLAPNIDRSSVKLLISTSAFNRNSYDTVGIRNFNLTDSLGNSAQVIVSGLSQLTTYYVTVAVMNSKGWFSRIAIPLNGCSFTTPQATDSIAPNGNALFLRADTSKLQPLTQIAYTVAGLNSISSPDRNTAVMRVCWSPTAFNYNFKVPPTGVSYFDLPLATMIGDSLKDELIYPLIPGSIKQANGTRYYLTMALRDTAYNWDTTHIKAAIGYTKIDTVRPANDTAWIVSRVGFSDLRISWNPRFFNKIPLTFRDTVPRVGIWLLNDSFTQAHVDTAAPTITMDSGSATPRSFSILTHNTRYYVACAPINTIDNRGRIRWNRSMYRIDVPFDSSTIDAPPNLCTLSVAHTTIPDSLKIRWKLPSLHYNDASNNVQIQLVQVMIRYRSDGIYPSSSSDGTLAGIYNLNPALFDSTIVGSIPLNSEIRFSAFIINQLSSGYSNRISTSAPAANAGIRSLFYPANQVVINSLTTLGGGGQPVKIRINWNIASGTLPTAVRFLVRTPADTPSSWNAAGYIVFTPANIAYNLQTDLIPDTLLNSSRYIVAAFVRSAEGVWSRSVVCDTITTPSGIDVTAPPRLPFALTGKKLDSKNIRLYWTIDSTLLANTKASENNRLAMIYGYTFAGADTFLNPINVRPYINPSFRINTYNAVDSLTISNLFPNRTYTFAVSTIDSANNQARTDSLSWTQLTLTVPPIPDSTISLTLLDDANYLIDWSKNVSTSGRKLWIADTNIKQVTYVIQKDSAYTGIFPRTNEIGDRLIKADYIDSLRFSENRFNWDAAPYYLTIWPTIDRNAGEAGTPLTKGPYRYKIDAPSLDSVQLVQLKDTLVQLSFIPRDTTESQIRLGLVSYAVNRAPDKIILKTAYDTSLINLSLDTIAVNQKCSVLIHINRLDQTEWAMISGNDSSVLKFKIDISDMRPVLKSTPDTSYLCTLKIDNKGPSNSVFTIHYDRSTRIMRGRLIPSAGDHIQSVIWGLSPTAIIDTFTTFNAGDTIKIDTTGINSIFMRLIDQYGNIKDTLWSDFTSSRLAFETLYKKTTLYDNGSVTVTVPDNAIVQSAHDNGYLTVGLNAIPNDSSALSLKGFAGCQPERYFFLSEIVNTAGIPPYYRNGIDVGFHLSIPDSGYRIFRLYPDGQLQNLGGELDASKSTIWLRRFVPNSIWNSQESAQASSNDSFTLIIAKDVVLPTIDTLSSGIVLSTASDSAKVVFKVHDNSIRLRAGWRVFTFQPNLYDSAVILWDTSTTALVSGKRGQPSATNDTNVLCEFDFTAAYKANTALWKKNGLFFSAWVSDGRKKFFFHSYPIKLDSLTGTFNSLNENWSVISITAKTDYRTDIVSTLTGRLKDNYDRQLVRIYALRGNSWIEYSRTDTAFLVAPGKSFIIMTRKSEENTVPFSTEKATLPSIKNSKGFLMASGGVTGGWQLVSLPYMGSVSQSTLLSSSITDDTAAGRVALINRMWRLDRNVFKEWNQNPSYTTQYRLYSTKGYGDGLLVYLYPGEQIIAPISENANYLTQRKSVARVGIVSNWNSSISFTSFDKNGKKSAENSFYQFGVSASDSMTLPVLGSPDQNFQAGFTGKEGLNSISRKIAKKGGWIWQIAATSTDYSNKAMSISLPSLSSIPDNLQVVLDNPLGGYSTDLRSAGGEFSFECITGTKRDFRIIVGDSLFVSQNAIQKRAPGKFDLAQNMPNPFNPSTIIRYQIPDFASGSGLAKSRVMLKLYDIRGREVKTLCDNVAQAGYYRVNWDGRNEFNSPVASGLYFYKITVTDSNGRNRYNTTKKMILLK